MSLADIIQIIIGVLSLVATIAVSFLIYWLQSRHEKEIQKLQCEKERIALQEKARLFLIDNQEETIINNKFGEDVDCQFFLEYTDAQAETYEDKYYETVQALYNAYYTSVVAS